MPADCDRLWQELMAEAQSKPWLLRVLGERGAALYLRFRAAHERLRRLRPGQLRGLQRKLGVGLAGAALLLALSGGAAAGAPAGAITVDGATCTLADAITAANTDAASGGCAAGSGADVLTLTNNIDLSSALPEISTEMTIEGGGHTIQRTGETDFGVLRVTATGNLTLNEATISGGMGTGKFPANGGGGIYNKGILTVLNSTLTGNSAPTSGGAIYNLGTSTVLNSTLTENSAYFGGGISNQSTLLLQNSTLSGNSGGYGAAGIESGGTLIVRNSTISGNSGSLFGGGMQLWGADSSMTIENSTIADNTGSRYGGGIQSCANLLIRNSTVSGNSAQISGGGIKCCGDRTLIENSLISGNETGRDGAEIFNNNNTGAVRTTGKNLFGHSGETNAQAFSSFTPGASDINATSDGMNLALASILEATLAENDTFVRAGVSPGSPVLTHALVEGSAAIDAVSGDNCPRLDQRGFLRNADGDGAVSETECDIGAFEYGDLDPLPVKAFLPIIFK